MHEKFLQKRIDMVNQKEKELLEKYGWLVHYVFETEGEYGGLANIHTHGLKESFNHPDIQVVLPIRQQTIHPVLAGIVEDIKNGKRFELNKRDNQVLKGMDVYFAPYEESGREVYRLILPDPNGKLPNEEGCDPIYQKQLEKLPE